MNNTHRIFLALLLSTLPLVFCINEARAVGPACIIKSGDFFPEKPFKYQLKNKEAEYLGIKIKKGFFGSKIPEMFSLRDINADLVVVEFFNCYCPSCQKQAYVLNDLFSMIERDEKLKKKVKMIGIAVGNTQVEVDRFKAAKEIPYPIIPDTHFEAYTAIGEPCGTPFTLLVRKSGDKAGIIGSSHFGLISSPEFFFNGIQDCLSVPISSFEKIARERSSLVLYKQSFVFDLSEEQLEEKIKNGMVYKGGRLVNFEKISLNDKNTLYIGKVELRPDLIKTVFSKIISRDPVCDVCHAVHFILFFNSSGKIVNFVPLHLTKMDNDLWDDNDVRKVKNRIIGRSILRPLGFNPEVDAVSTATMSTAIVFNAIERTLQDYRELKKKGYISEGGV